MLDLEYTLSQLSSVLPLLVTGLVISLLVTPVMGRIAKNIGAIDLTLKDRKRGKTKTDEGIMAKATPRLGGVAIYISFVLLMFLTQGFTTLTVGLFIGLTILTVMGIMDDIHDYNGLVQITFQALAAIVIVLAGVRIMSVDIFGYYIDFDMWSTSFTILGQTINVILIADIVTVVWLLVIINAMNWVAGIDALEETMSWVAGLTMMFLAIKFGQEGMLELTAIFTGAVIGFWFFNFPPARIYGGTVANTILGYLLGIFAILISGKMTTALLLLALPLIDFLWVLLWRMYKYKQFNPMKLMSISGDHHLHHRLMRLGYSQKQTLLIEISIFGVFAVGAYYLAGFNIMAVAVLGAFALIILFFAAIAMMHKSGKKKKKKVSRPDDPEPPTIQPQDPQKPPESVYAY